MECKKRWKKPRLIVLNDTRPEERVLAFCKTGQAGQGPEGFLGTCFVTSGFQLCREWTNS